MKEYKRSLIRIFLNEYKAAAIQSFILVPRKENRDTLRELEITVKDCRNEILSLLVEDYQRGPEDDRDIERGGTVWFFGKNIRGREIYIKLKLNQAGRERSAVCISFHFAESPLDYPLRDKGEKRGD